MRHADFAASPVSCVAATNAVFSFTGITQNNDRIARRGRLYATANGMMARGLFLNRIAIHGVTVT